MSSPKELQESGTPVSATLSLKETWHGPCFPSKSRANLALGHSAKRSALAREWTIMAWVLLTSCGRNESP